MIGRMVYRMFFLGCNFAGSSLYTKTQKSKTPRFFSATDTIQLFVTNMTEFSLFIFIQEKKPVNWKFKSHLFVYGNFCSKTVPYENVAANRLGGSWTYCKTSLLDPQTELLQHIRRVGERERERAVVTSRRRLIADVASLSAFTSWMLAALCIARS